jgi:N-acetylglucosamine malate deacetylase 1
MIDILVIGAHPDDESFGMGASIIKFSKLGYKLGILTLTKGQAGTFGDVDTRMNELKAAADFLDAELVVLDLEDTKIENTNENRLKVAEIVRKLKPKIVFCPYPRSKFNHLDGAAHFDHTNTGKLVTDALRVARFKGVKLENEEHSVDYLIYYILPKNKLPNFINDVSEYQEEFYKLLECYGTQLNTHKGQIKHILDTIRKSNGLLIKSKYGEGFIIEEPVKLDIEFFIKNKEAWKD